MRRNVIIVHFGDINVKSQTVCRKLCVINRIEFLRKSYLIYKCYRPFYRLAPSRMIDNKTIRKKNYTKFATKFLNMGLTPPEMEKRNKIAQTQVLDLRNSTKTRDSRHITIHDKTA